MLKDRGHMGSWIGFSYKIKFFNGKIMKEIIIMFQLLVY